LHKIDGIIHFAAKIVVPESISYPLEYYHNNTMGVISILTAAKKSNVKNLVFSSTAAVYGNDHKDLISETALTNPINPYGKSKLFSEQIIRDSEIEFGLRSVIFRYFNVAGASVDSKYGQCSKNATHLIKIASEAASFKRESMNITGTDYNTPDGTGVRDYIHVSDLAHAHVLGMKYLFDGGKSEIFNCGYGKGSSVKEVVSAVKKVSGVDFKVLLTERRPGDADSLVSNPSKLKNMLQWEPKYNDLEFICKTAFLFEKNLS
jgi:UDP-glucose 4-epimerase